MKIMKMKLVAAAALMALVAPIASADTISIDANGIESFGFEGDAGNTVLIFDLGANATINSIGWDLSIEAVSPSWLEEAQIGFSTDGGNEILDLFPGVEDQGPGFSAGMQASSLITGADGLLTIEFYEISFDDIVDGADAIWSGQIDIDFTPEMVAVPVPATLGLIGIGLLGMVARRRMS